MKVIFLDMDGVANSEAYLLKIDAKHRALGHEEPTRPKSETTCICYRLRNQVDPDAIARLNRIIAATDAKVVMSTSWRKLLEPAELLAILVEHGFVGDVIGQTPGRDEEEEVRTAYGYPSPLYRGYEIDYWLRQHPEVEKFVILDDGSDMVMHIHRLVQTDAQEGLLDEHVELAIAMLTSDVKIPMPNRGNCVHWDKVGAYIVSTIRLPESIATAVDAQFETLVYSIAEGAWDTDGSGVHTATEHEAIAAHLGACARIRERMQ